MLLGVVKVWGVETVFDGFDCDAAIVMHGGWRLLPTQKKAVGALMIVVWAALTG